MQGVVIVDGNDLSNYIVEGSYKMDSEDIYESWKDANYVTHRIIIAHKISGTFDMVVNPKNEVTVADIYDIFNDASDDGVIIAGVYVSNTGATEAIECYWSITNKEHELKADGTFIDILTVKLEEC